MSVLSSALGKKKSCMVWKKCEVRLTVRGTTFTSKCSFTEIPATERGGRKGERERKKEERERYVC